MKLITNLESQLHLGIFPSSDTCTFLHTFSADGFILAFFLIPFPHALYLRGMKSYWNLFVLDSNSTALIQTLIIFHMDRCGYNLLFLHSHNSQSTLHGACTFLPNFLKVKSDLVVPYQLRQYLLSCIFLLHLWNTHWYFNGLRKCCTIRACFNLTLTDKIWTKYWGKTY